MLIPLFNISAACHVINVDDCGKDEAIFVTLKEFIITLAFVFHTYAYMKVPAKRDKNEETVFTNYSSLLCYH